MSFAGRYMVLIPFGDKVSVSSKIKKGEERTRLKQLVQSIRPKNFGVIVRTSAEGKRVAETLFFDYHRQHNVDIKVMRIFNTYGPRMDMGDGRVVSNFIVQALKGEDITIYGDGSQTRSFCYVDDLIEGMIRLMNSREGFTGPVNVGNPGEFTIKELAEKVIEMTDSDSKIIYKELPVDDPTQRKPDISLARKELDWEPKIELEEGLKNTIEYFRSRIKEMEETKL